MSELHSIFKVTEVELIYKSKTPAKDRFKISCGRDAYEVLFASWNKNKIELQEEFKIMLLNRGNSCLGISHISTGGTSACVVDPKLVFSTALKSNASGIILAHNHPSGNLKPSQADISLTLKLREGGRLLDIEVLDHLIITTNGFLSLESEGLMP